MKASVQQNSRFLSTCLLACCSLAPVAMAGEGVSGNLNIGMGYVSDKAFKFGEYNGLDNQGLYPVLDFSLKSAADPRWSDADYWELSGNDLGLNSRELSFQWGQRFTAIYDEITHQRSSGGGSVFVDNDSSDLRLPANWTAATNTAGMAPFALNELDESIKRRRLKLGYQLPAFGDWELDFTFRHEVRDGNRVRYGIIGNTGGNPRAVALPSPVDFTENALTVTASRAGEGFSLQGGYRLSLFDNDNTAQSWDNPYAAIGGWSPAAGYPSGRGAIALEPDNRYQQLFTSLYYRLSKSASIHGSASYARMEQDEHFLPYTINPALAVTTPRPRDSLEGKIDISRLRVTYQHRLTPRLSLRVNGAYEDRDNKTPRDLYIYIGGDSQDQSTAASSRARYNRPYSDTRTEVDAALRYRWQTGTELALSQSLQRVDRDYSEISRMEESVSGLALSRRQSDSLQWRASYALERRDPSAYRGDRPYYASHSDAYIASTPEAERFENHPLLRKYYLAERDRQKASAGLTWTASANVQWGLSYQSTRDDYDKSELGLLQARTQGLNVDLSVIDEERFSWNSFYSVERIESEQAGHSFRGFAVAADIGNPGRAWEHDSEDNVKTLGSDLTLYRLWPKVDMTLSYLLSYAVSELDTQTGNALSAEPISPQGDKLKRLSAKFDYEHSPQLGVSVRIAHESYEVDNFSYDNVAADTMANVIALGRSSGDYSINWLALSFRYRF